MKPGDIVTNTHVHTSIDSGTLLALKLLGVYDKWAWCLAMTGIHKGSPLTFEIKDLKLYEETLKELNTQ